MNEYEISVVSGDSYELDLNYKDSDLEVIDVSNYTVYFQMKESKCSNTIVFDKSFTVSVEDGVLGLIKFSLTPYETQIMCGCGSNKKFVYGMRLSSPDQTDVKTILTGTIEVEKGTL